MNDTAKQNIYQKDSHEYDLTAGPCFGLATHDDCSNWVAITSVPPISSLSLSFMGGVGLRKQKQILDANLFFKKDFFHIKLVALTNRILSWLFSFKGLRGKVFDLWLLSNIYNVN